MATKKKEPSFAKCMTFEEVIAYLRTRVECHKKETTKTKAWDEDELLLRNQVIIHYMSKGLSRVETARQIMNDFGIQKSSAFKWIRSAVEYLAEGSDEYKDAMKEVQLERLHKYVTDCTTQGKYKEAAMFMEQMNKIYGIYNETKKVEVKAEGPIKFEFDGN